MNDCPLCENGIIVTVEYSLIGNPPERSGVPCWRCLTARAEKAEQELARVLAIVDANATRSIYAGSGDFVRGWRAAVNEIRTQIGGSDA